jgi:hypothetical protein
MLPLNGTKTHPLTDHAREQLLDIAAKPVPRQCLVSEVMLTSPFKAHKGKSIAHLQITTDGRKRLGLPPAHGCGHMQGRGAA